MDEHILAWLFDQPNSPMATPYLRGLAQVIQQRRIDFILTRTNRCQRRRGRLLASSTVWLVIAMSLFATHSIPMVWRSLHPYTTIPDPDDSTFTKARQRLGVAPMRELFHDLAPVLAAPGTPGVFYRSWRLMGIDGTTFDMPDTPENARIFGRGGNQRSPNAFPHVRVMALVNSAPMPSSTSHCGPSTTANSAWVPRLARSLQPGMLLLWDRNFYGFDLIQSVLDRGSSSARAKSKPAN